VDVKIRQSRTIALWFVSLAVLSRENACMRRRIYCFPLQGVFSWTVPPTNYSTNSVTTAITLTIAQEGCITSNGRDLFTSPPKIRAASIYTWQIHNTCELGQWGM
jgi:hypothetical protein